jgi:prepilin-type N-terminal cleavage/methylation domain-containing protein
MKLSHAKLKRTQAGLTLVELMVSLTLGLILLAGVGTLFLYTSRSNKQNEMLSSMQDQARFALSTLSRDLMMAGYWGGMASAENIIPNTSNPGSSGGTALTPAIDCGPNATTSLALKFTNTTTTTLANGTTVNEVWPNRIEFWSQASGITNQWRCVGGYRTGTDALAIRHVAGRATASISNSATQVTLRPYNFYLMTNGIAATLMRNTEVTARDLSSITESPSSGARSFYRYVLRIYYVRDYARTAGDNTPSLCRKELCPSGLSGSGESATCTGSGAATGFYTECLAEGVEDLQIIWGIASNGGDVADHYTSTPSAREVAEKATTAQIFLRVRSLSSDTSYTDDKTYTVDGVSYSPASETYAQGTAESEKAKHFYRRIYSTTVKLRNPAR